MIQNLKSNITPTFCPGCNNFVLYAAIQQVITQLQIPKKDVVLVFDIGCIGNMADFFSTYGIHSLHGRSIATAMGVKMANPKLTVIAIGGDGGIYGEGFNHLFSAARYNLDITVLVANNQLYSLTTGQTSPTTPQGSKTKSTPLGAPSFALNPVKVLQSVNPKIDVKSVDGTKLPEITSAIKSAINNPEFSLIDIRQTCVTFGKQLKS